MALFFDINGCNITGGLLPHLFRSAPRRGGVAPLLFEDLLEDLQVGRDDGAVVGGADATVARPEAGVAAAAPRAGNRRRRRRARRLQILQDVSLSAAAADAAGSRRGRGGL